MSPENIVRGRVRAQASWWAFSPLVVTAMAVVFCHIAIWRHATEYEPDGSKELTLTLLVSGMAATIWFFACAYTKADRLRRPLVGVPSLVRVPIAKAAHDGSTLAAIEGRVTRTAQGPEMASPLSDVHCLYHRVRVDTWRLVPRGVDPWSSHYDRWQLEPFVVDDGSGFVLIEPYKREDGTMDPVEVDVQISSRVTIHESPSGLRGLPEHARAYIEANREHLPYLKDDQRVRVTEVLLREGDVVSVIGPIEERVVQAGAYRADGAERILVMDGWPRNLSDANRNRTYPWLRVLPARLEELRWLVAFHRRLTVALVVGGVLGLAAMGLGLARMVSR